VTPKQIERLQKKISDVKRTIAAKKRKYGCYDDSRGIRYIPTRYFIQLGDYSGGLKYIKWFSKCFPDDSGFPDFLFEWTIILFKNGMLKEAEKKAFKTFCSNTYIIGKYFSRPITPVVKWEGSNLEAPSYVENLIYTSADSELKDFTEWLEKFISSENFINVSNKCVEINIRLKIEDDREMRHYLVVQASQLVDSI